MNRIAILGAGVMGVSLALFLARAGRNVTLFDAAAAPMSGASRWNEGKIHLGYLYGADPSFETARRVIPGGLTFAPLLHELIGSDPAPHITAEPDNFLIHRNSVAAPDQLRHLYGQLDELVAVMGGKPVRSSELTPSALAGLTPSSEILTGFSIPEHSMDTQWAADHLVAALDAEPLIDQRMESRITLVTPTDGGRWTVATSSGAETFDLVVNALWNGKLAIDRTAGLAMPRQWSHRFRRALFVETAEPVAARSSTIAVGPFGDFKAYDDRHFYLSWYPSGLALESDEIDPAPPAAPDVDALTRAVRDNLGHYVSAIPMIIDHAASIRAEGGFVYAEATGKLDDPKATIHARDKFGVRRTGSYFSVDTGKYSTAPWLAKRLSETILSGAPDA